eukprot:87504-Prorocentrum_minimum.AAC.1
MALSRANSHSDAGIRNLPTPGPPDPAAPVAAAVTTPCGRHGPGAAAQLPLRSRDGPSGEQAAGRPTSDGGSSDLRRR